MRLIDSKKTRERAAEILRAGGFAFTSVSAVRFVNGRGAVVNYWMGVTPGCEYWLPASMFSDNADLRAEWRRVERRRRAARERVKPAARRGPSLQDWMRAFDSTRKLERGTK